jgi:hypothetical protein
MILTRTSAIILSTLTHRSAIFEDAFTSTAARSTGDLIHRAAVLAHRANMPSFTFAKSLTVVWFDCAGAVFSTAAYATYITILADIILDARALRPANLPTIFILIFASAHELCRFLCEGRL